MRATAGAAGRGAALDGIQGAINGGVDRGDERSANYRHYYDSCMRGR